MSTHRLSLDTLVSGQSGKEVTVNTALQKVDAMICCAVESMTTTAPPAGVNGALYLIPVGASGDWASNVGKIAYFAAGAWMYLPPVEGFTIRLKSTNQVFVYKNGSWTDALSARTLLGFFGATPVAKTTVTMSTTDGAIGGLTISDTYSSTEVKALRDGTETLADDVRAIKTTLSNLGLM